ncbi:hypothetical protein C8Q79DRAFT_922350 [Trametes meyenii]|nr:hypothetical protein C8Q79DRAFT_922350 [Trametes meyenii]
MAVVAAADTSAQLPLSVATDTAAEGGIQDAAPVPATPTQNAGKGKGFRALRERIPLRRAFSMKHASLSTPTLLSPLSPTRGDADPAFATKTRTKLTAFERFVNAKLSARKNKKNKQTADDASADDALIPVELNPTPSSSSSFLRPENVAALPAILESAAPAAEPAPPAPEQPRKTDAVDSDPEPLPLARKIQSLLSSLPPFLSPLSPVSAPSTDTPTSDPSGGDSDGHKKQSDGDEDPSAPATIDNSRLISLLSSPSMMNGSLTRGRQSVWALLDNLRLKSLTSSSSDGQATPASSSLAATEEQATIEDDDSVMFYGPLIPDATSEVELARSEIVSVDENGTIVDVLLDDAPLPGAPPKARFGGIWPFSSGARTTSPTPPPAKPKVLVEKRVWVPSTAKLSLQVMWWGYRLWLPPPIMNLLNDKEIEAAKLGAMLTTALQWLLSNVPDSALPPTLRPALALVKSLVPYLGYIGGFVAWSWGAIKGFDNGNGVTLTATWLLPIALIPGTWEDDDVPQPQPQPQPPAAGDPASNPSPPSSDDPPAPGPGSPGPTGDPSVSGPSPAVPGGGASTPATTTPIPPASGSVPSPTTGAPITS